MKKLLIIVTILRSAVDLCFLFSVKDSQSPLGKCEKLIFARIYGHGSDESNPFLKGRCDILVMGDTAC